MKKIRQSGPAWVVGESARLLRSWERHEPEFLRDYLVAEVEDPRLNVQSILTRHFLLRALLGEEQEPAMALEIHFALVLNWLQRLFRETLVRDDLLAISNALRRGADNAEGREIPAWVVTSVEALAQTRLPGWPPEAVWTALEQARQEGRQWRLPAAALDTGQCYWQQTLARRRLPKLSVLEPACGSANDYRFFHAFGLARCLIYTGFDLSPKNIANAQAMFPRARFITGNVLDFKARRASRDVCVVHDLFEHLSPEAMELAVTRVCQWARHAVCAGFFNMHEAEEHQVNPVGDYHWNRLSMPRTRELFEAAGFDVQVIHIGTFLAREYGCPVTHNPYAYTFQAYARR